jgi:hypothetical protein
VSVGRHPASGLTPVTQSRAVLNLSSEGAGEGAGEVQSSGVKYVNSPAVEGQAWKSQSGRKCPGESVKGVSNLSSAGVRGLERFIIAYLIPLSDALTVNTITRVFLLYKHQARTDLSACSAATQRVCCSSPIQGTVEMLFPRPSRVLLTYSTCPSLKHCIPAVRSPSAANVLGMFRASSSCGPPQLFHSLSLLDLYVFCLHSLSTLPLSLPGTKSGHTPGESPACSVASLQLPTRGCSAWIATCTTAPVVVSC